MSLLKALGPRIATVALLAVACGGTTEPEGLATRVTVTRAGFLPAFTALRAPSAHAAPGAVTLMLSDAFADPGFEMLGHARITPGERRPKLVVTVTSRRLRGAFLHTIAFMEYDVVVTVSAGAYDLEVIRKHDDPSNQLPDRVAFLSTIVVS